jgi:MFS family permease
MVNNLNDGLAWGLFPLFFATAGLDLAQIGILSFTYPAAWGLLQLWTGALSDRWGRKGLIASGMLVQGAALAAIAIVRGFWPWLGACALLGLGTAMVYPTLLAATSRRRPGRPLRHGLVDRCRRAGHAHRGPAGCPADARDTPF